ncbi:MAG TPA: hypothetical protein DDW27_08355, partial [Bacteroidales bacterium]|nr:hypothetical protein [Bacteroidales bacterium]
MATLDPGPFTALFDYQEEQKKLEERKKQQAEAQKRIMRTNTLGDAFRLLIDVVGGSRGASIVPRPVNPAIMQASERLRTQDTDYQNQADRLMLQNLRAKEMDLQHQLGIGAEERQRTWESEKLAGQRQWEGEKLDQANKFQLERDRLNAQYAKELENVRSKNDLTQLQERYKGEMEKITTKAQEDLRKAGGLYVARYDNPSQTEPVDRDVVVGMFKDLRQYLEDKGLKHSLDYPKVLQAENKGNISNDDL